MAKLYKINIDDKQIEYTLMRSHRKTIGININRDGRVKISAPFTVSEKQIKEVVAKKASWIVKKQEEILNKEEIKEKEFVNGELFLYMGKELTLRVTEKKISTPKTVLNANEIEVLLPGGKEGEEKSLIIKQALKIWYLKQFESIIRERIPKYASIIGKSPGRVTIREQKTRWGSCSGKGNINLNWKLIMAPLEVLDYVIVHEICHMKEMNHSKTFWSLVETIIPYYSKSRKWLKENGHSLRL